MTDTGIETVGWAFWDPGTLEWRVAAEEPVAYYDREPVVRLSIVRLITRQLGEARRERDGAMKALSDYSAHLDEVLEELRAVRARLERAEIGTVTAPIPEVHGDTVDDGPGSAPFQTLEEWQDRRWEQEREWMDGQGVEF